MSYCIPYICTISICQLYLNKAGKNQTGKVWCDGKSEGSRFGPFLSIQRRSHATRGSAQCGVANGCAGNSRVIGSEYCLNGVVAVVVEVSWKHIAFLDFLSCLKAVSGVECLASPSCRSWNRAQGQIGKSDPGFRRLGYWTVFPSRHVYTLKVAAHGVHREVIRDGWHDCGIGGLCFISIRLTRMKLGWAGSIWELVEDSELECLNFMV